MSRPRQNGRLTVFPCKSEVRSERLTMASITLQESFSCIGLIRWTQPDGCVLYATQVAMLDGVRGYDRYRILKTTLASPLSPGPACTPCRPRTVPHWFATIQVDAVLHLKLHETWTANTSCFLDWSPTSAAKKVETFHEFADRRRYRNTLLRGA